MFGAFEAFHWGLMGLALGAASVLDLAERRIPNWLTVALAVYGLMLRYLVAGVPASLWGLAGVVVGLALLLGPFAKGWIGGGDVKLFAATGAWLAPWLALEALLYAIIAGGLLSLAYWALAPRQVRRDIWLNLKLSVLSLRMAEVQRRPVRLDPPYAPAIAAGVVTVFVRHAGLLLVR